MIRLIRYRMFPTKTPSTCDSNVNVTHLQKRNVYTHHSFDEIPYRDLRSLNSQLASYVRTNNFLSTWTLFCHMHCACLNLDAYTFTPVLGACSSLPGPERGKQVHGLMIKTGSDTGTVSKTALMDMYSKFGFLNESVRVFEEMEFKDVVTWNALLSSFLRHGLAKEAFDVFEAMRRERVEVSEFTLTAVLKACASLKAFEQGKQVHSWAVVLGWDMVVLGTALIDFYSVVGCISDAMKVFYSFDGRVDDVMRNSLISGCFRNRKYEEAFSIISTMRLNVVALTSALSACSENSDLWMGKQFHCLAIRFGFTSYTQLCNVLLDMYAKCGKISDAGSLFDRICRKDVVSWTSMIDAYGSHGHGLEALKLFKKMGEEGSGVSPNSVTFLVVLSACAHSGLVEQGRECFNLMREKYGLNPGPEHYVCFIDTLGRAGQIEEVWCLFNDMVKNGTKITPAVWGALVNACSYSLDVTRGEFAAKHLLELEPDVPAYIVLLSNFYATIGKWETAEHLRSSMRKIGSPKVVGSSWVS
ncbi:pentatricopeptide repeat-containing protein At5g66500, mitochondrial-like [Pistacia vera]|uniref:pentatricopeptide repeat-containing protein At5g66500, mitochondrial-like n=1 Tax=Pistacia vera TaxID=55513 RepID=UPI0012631FC9|nr:pentatricopeptide repeat-containing protein At5g66500, mitochondrial-like [Pistacia vera]